MWLPATSGNTAAIGKDVWKRQGRQGLHCWAHKGWLGCLIFNPIIDHMLSRQICFYLWWTWIHQKPASQARKGWPTHRPGTCPWRPCTFSKCFVYSLGADLRRPQIWPKHGCTKYSKRWLKMHLLGNALTVLKLGLINFFRIYDIDSKHISSRNHLVEIHNLALTNHMDK